jgi:hypothetical protein
MEAVELCKPYRQFVEGSTQHVFPFPKNFSIWVHQKRFHSFHGIHLLNNVFRQKEITVFKIVFGVSGGTIWAHVRMPWNKIVAQHLVEEQAVQHHVEVKG